jgi:hypothetical protein
MLEDVVFFKGQSVQKQPFYKMLKSVQYWEKRFFRDTK